VFLLRDFFHQNGRHLQVAEKREAVLGFLLGVCPSLEVV
jgi:hypothetical protein